jgi:hypothetical protein
MADLNETVAAVDEFDAWVQGIYQLEQEDLVLGGADGIDNLQAKQLLARSNWLKAQVLGLGAGKQPLDAMLTALSSLVTEADQTLYFTGPDAPALTALTAYARTLIAAADAAAARATLGAASPADIAAAIAALVNSSPATLDTLNELAAALGNDANFATTITNALALKAPLDSATESAKGLIELATAAEAQAMTDDVRALTAAKLSAAFQGSNQSLADSGYQKLPGGLMFQWGGAAITNVDTAYNFPIAFPNACFGVVIQDGASESAGHNFAAQIYTASQFKAISSSPSIFCTFFAFGK